MSPAGPVAGLAVAVAALVAVAPRRRPVHRLGIRTTAVPAPSRLSRRAVVLPAAAVAIAGALVLAPAVTVGAAAAAGVVGPVAVLLVRRRRDRRLAAARAVAVVDLCYALAAELRAGRPPAAALTAVGSAAGPLAGPLREAAALTATGVPAADELRRIAELPGASALGPVADVWQVTEQHGGPVADVLDRFGEALDDEATARRALEAALAGPRATMTLLLGLPVFGVLLGESVGAHPVALLVHRPLGWALLTGAVVLDAAGVTWTRRLLVTAARP